MLQKQEVRDDERPPKVSEPRHFPRARQDVAGRSTLERGGPVQGNFQSHRRVCARTSGQGQTFLCRYRAAAQPERERLIVSLETEATPTEAPE